MNPARERMLRRLREALKQRLPMPHPEVQDDSQLFEPAQESDLLLEFALRLRAQDGHFFFAESWEEAIDQLSLLCIQQQWPQPYCNQIKLSKVLSALGFETLSSAEASVGDLQVGIHNCEALIARSGTILLSSARGNGRHLSILPEVQIVLATSDQLVPDLAQALGRLQGRYGGQLPSMCSLVTGPSRTADIEKTLVLGAHGPKALYVFVIEP